MSSSDNISEQLKVLRRKCGWSQEDLARELGVSFATVNRWENRKTKPSKMAKVQIDRLLSEQMSQLVSMSS